MDTLPPFAPFPIGRTADLAPDAPLPTEAFDTLLAGLLAGAPVASLLFAIHWPCRRLLALADFCQEVLARALCHRASFHGRDAEEFRHWLQAIGRQLAVTLLRRSRGRTLAPLPKDLPGHEASAHEVVVREEELSRVQQRMADLPSENCDLLLRHYGDGETFVQIARRWGQHPKMVARKHARLLADLRKAQES